MYTNPYYAAFNPYAMAVQHNTPTLQPQQIIQVSGKASVDTIQLAQATSGVLRFPNSWAYDAGVFPPIVGGTTTTTLATR